VRRRDRGRTGPVPGPAGGKPLRPDPGGAGGRPTTWGFDAGEPLFRALGVDLTAIDGIDVGTALVVLAEIGVDVSRFPTEQHFASWLGLCPRQHESNRTKKNRAPRKGKNRVAVALRMAAQGLGRTQSPLGLSYRRIKGRIGGKGAVTAAAHKLACPVYRMLKYGTEYVRRTLDEYEQKVRAQVERPLRRTAAAEGYELVRAGGGPAPAVATA
jgi:transposase